jgi:hypothetical protein
MISLPSLFLTDFFLTYQATSDPSGPAPFDAALEGTRSAVQKAVEQYVASKFVSEASVGGAYTKDGKVVVVIVGEKPSLRNFWSGRWSSTWTICPEMGAASISGDIKVRNMRYEVRVARFRNVFLLLGDLGPRTLLRGRQCAIADLQVRALGLS